MTAGTPKKTLYQILGVAPDAGIAEIEAACRGISAAADPNLRAIGRDALDILSDPARRAAYDARLAPPAPGAGAREAQAYEPEAAPLSALLASRWLKWVVAAMIVVAAVAWWKSRKPKAVASPQTIAAPALREAGPRTVYVVQAPENAQAGAAPAGQAAAETAPKAPLAARSGADVFAEAAPSVAFVTVLGAGGSIVASGSGVVTGREQVITNCHVIRRGSEVRVKVGKTVLPAIAGLADEELDLCRLHVAGLAAPAVSIGSVETLRPGQRVFAIGAPQGLELSLSDGIVSSLREVPGGKVIQITAPISAGSSGGGLFDESGTLVGITTFQSRYGQNLNFAVPADWIGEMRARRVGAAGSGTLPTGQASSSPDKLILGKWLCRSAISGLNGDFEFREDGIVVGKFDGNVSGARYELSGRTLRLKGKQTSTYGVDSITPDKMVFDAGEGRRIVCER